MSITKTMLSQRNSFDKDVDKDLPKIISEFDEMNTLLVEVYDNVKDISDNEYLSNQELNDIIKNLDKTNRRYYLSFVALLLMANSNKKDILTKVGIYNILSNSSKKQLINFNDIFSRTADTIYTSDILQKNIVLTNYDLKEILDYRINNIHYSTRLWKDNMVLSDKLYETFNYGFLNDLSLSEMANNLSDVTGVGYSSSLRLLRTELTGVVSSTYLKYFNASGISRVQQVSTLDNRTSDICIERDGAIINVSDAIIGENIPPLHPWCRSIIIPLTK